MNPFLDWLKDSGTQAMLVLLATVCAIVAAVASIYFGRKSLTKRDLISIEQNTGHLGGVRATIASLDERAKRREDTDELAGQAKWVSISARGVCDTGKPLPIRLTGKDSSVRFVRVELYSEIGNVFGSAECRDTEEPFQQIVEIPYLTLVRWKVAGTRIDQFETRHVLRIWMRYAAHNQYVYRDMPVSLTVRSTGEDDSPERIVTLSLVGEV